MADSSVFVSFGADTGGLEAALAVTQAQVKAATAELRALAREMQATGAAADSDLGQKVLAAGAALTAAKGHVSELKTELGGVGKEAGAGIGEASISIGSLGDSLKHMAELAGIAFSVEAIKDWISETTEAAEKIEQVAAKFGATPEQIQMLGAEAKLAGVDFGEMQMQMDRLQLSLAKTAEKSSPAAAALHALGVDVQQFRAASMTGQLEMLAAATSRYADGANKTAAMQALLGRSGADMIPYLDRGREGIEELNRAIEATGVIMAGSQVEAFARTYEDLVLLADAWKGLSQRIFAAVNGPIDLATQQLTRFVASISPGEIEAAFNALGSGAITLGETTAAACVRIADAWDLLEPQVFKDIGKLIDDYQKLDAETKWVVDDMVRGFQFLTGDYVDAFRHAATEGAAAFGTLDEAGTRLALRLQGVHDAAEAARKELAELSSAKSNADKYGGLDSNWSSGAAGKPNVPQMDLGGVKEQARQAAEAIKSAFDGAFDAAKRDATSAEDAINNALRLHQITAQQVAQQTIAALEKEAAAVADATQKALEATNLSATQRATIEEKELNAFAEIAKKEADAQTKAAEEAAASWKVAADKMSDAINGQVDSLLRGTETMGQAFKKMTAGMIEDAIKWSIKAIGENAAVVAAHVTGATTIAAADQSASAAGALSWIDSALHSIATAAAQTFAGVTAFMAPTVGPAAPAFGAAAMGTVTAVEGMLYDTGAWSVPRDMIAGIHAGEMIVPQRGGVADEFRSFMAGGGFSGDGGRSVTVAPTVHFHNSPYDDSGFERLLNSNGGRLLKAVDHAVRNGAHLGLRGLRR